MATRPRTIAVFLGVALTVWIWALAGTLFAIKWTAFARPGAPTRPLFPYGEIRVGVDASYPPFAAASSSDLFGLDIDLGKALGEQLHTPVRFVNMGYDGLYDALRTDQVDVLISALLVDPSKTQAVFYTQPYFNAGLVLVSDAGSPLQSMADMPSHSLAYEFGSAADAEAKRWLRRVLPFDTRPYELPEYALDAVRLNQADAALVDAVSARLYLHDHADWQAQYPYVTVSPMAIAVRIDRWDRWQAVSLALQSLIDDGTLEIIIERWL